MPDTKAQENVELLKQELLELLGAQDKKALKVIGKLKRMAQETNDINLLGYAYYRYAYYYYFTRHDIRKFRRNLEQAIHYLIRGTDAEYLGSAYNLVAYDAQDQGSYDTAYAYFMMALQSSKDIRGIALPGLVEANAGRILTELGNYREGRIRIRSAIRRLKSFTSMHVYHYNMIITYADEALASFLLADGNGVVKAVRNLNAHMSKADENEAELAHSYVILSELYPAVLGGDAPEMTRLLIRLDERLAALPEAEASGMIFEVESLFDRMLKQSYPEQAKHLLTATGHMRFEDSYSTALRYYALWIRYCEAAGDQEGLSKNLKAQHEIYKRYKEERIRVQRYSMEFVEMIGVINGEMIRAKEENEELQVKANTDALTGLPNRSAMNTALGAMFEDAQFDRTRFGIGIMDVDEFKQYNDTYGHQAGDEALISVGKVLQEAALDPRVFAARYGGDEFIVCYKGMEDEEILAVSEQIRAQIMEGVWLRDNGKAKGTARASLHAAVPAPSVSQGICGGTPNRRQKLWDYLSAADRELYRIKKEGVKEKVLLTEMDEA